MNAAAAAHVLELVRARQERRDTAPEKHPRKVAAKQRAREIALGHHGPARRILDVGGEEWYWPMFAPAELVAVNHPQDAHEMEPAGEFDGALAMHVLEHSPFPALLLELMRRAVTPGGWIYVAVPHPTRKWREYRAHVTMMLPDSWAHLFIMLGLEIVHRESGRFGRRRSVEERFLLRT
jgi:SAM-dependent methyltransferase